MQRPLDLSFPTHRRRLEDHRPGLVLDPVDDVKVVNVLLDDDVATQYPVFVEIKYLGEPGVHSGPRLIHGAIGEVIHLAEDRLADVAPVNAGDGLLEYRLRAQLTEASTSQVIYGARVGYKLP